MRYLRGEFLQIKAGMGGNAGCFQDYSWPDEVILKELKLQKKPPNKTYCYSNDLGHLFPTDGTYS